MLVVQLFLGFACFLLVIIIMLLVSIAEYLDLLRQERHVDD